MTHSRLEAEQGRRTPWRWAILVVIVGLMLASLGCSLAPRLELLALAEGPRGMAVARGQALVTYTPAPTFTPTAPPLQSPTPTATWLPWPTPTATDTPVPIATAVPTFTPLPTATPWPTDTPAPPQPTTTLAARVVAAAPSPATPTPSPTPAPGYDYLVNEVYIDRTTVPFLTGYIAIVNAQEIPIGGVRAVGVFEPDGQRHESPLSQWFFDVSTAPGAVAKTGSVKFEPGGIQAGTWFIHLEDEWGTRLSEDVAINTNPDNPEWFYVKFRQPGLAVAMASTPTPAASPSIAAVTTTGGSNTTTSNGWSFVNVRIVTDPVEVSVILYGDMVNNTGSSQEISYLTGTFSDSRGRTVSGSNYTYDYWPTELVPPGGVIPFELTVYNLQSVADFALEVIAKPSSETPRQNFEFLDVNASGDTTDYCVTGKLRNSGGQLGDYLVVAAALYDDQDKVMNFDSVEDYSPEDVVGDQTLDFELCADPLGDQVARYEVKAWGQ